MKSTKRIISIILALLIVSYIFAMHSIATDVPKDESCETETTRAFTTGSLDVIKTTNPEYRITTMPDITTTKGKVTNPSCRPSKDCFNVTIVPEKYSYSWNEKVVFKINIKMLIMKHYIILILLHKQVLKMFLLLAQIKIAFPN